MNLSYSRQPGSKQIFQFISKLLIIMDKQLSVIYKYNTQSDLFAITYSLTYVVRTIIVRWTEVQTALLYCKHCCMERPIIIETLCYIAGHLYGLIVPLLPFSLTAGHQQCMLAYWHQNWNNQHWSHVISVEFRASLYNHNGHAWVFLRVVERLVDCCILETFVHEYLQCREACKNVTLVLRTTFFQNSCLRGSMAVYHSHFKLIQFCWQRPS